MTDQDDPRFEYKIYATGDDWSDTSGWIPSSSPFAPPASWAEHARLYRAQVRKVLSPREQRHAKIDVMPVTDLRKFAHILLDLNENMEEVLRLAPDCRAHGALCLPHLRDYLSGTPESYREPHAGPQ